MFSSKASNSKTQSKLTRYIKSDTFFRLAVVAFTLLAAFLIIYNSAVPKKYRLVLGEVSKYDIIAPRDLENKIKTIENREAAANAVPPVTREIGKASIDVINAADDFFYYIEMVRKDIEKKLENKGVSRKDKNYKQHLEAEQDMAAKKLEENIKSMGVPVSPQQVRYLIEKASEEELEKFKRTLRDQISNIMSEDVTLENLATKVNKAQNLLQAKDMSQDLKNIGELVIKAVVVPNREIDEELTKKEKDKAYHRPENIVMILKGQRIISKEDLVTQDKLAILNELNLVETGSRFELGFAIGIFIILLLLAVILLLYIANFCHHIIKCRNDMLLISVVILLTLLITRGFYEITPEYFMLAAPVFIAPMLISILLDLRLAAVVNFVLAAAISLIARGDLRFICMVLISGTISAFLVSKANQRSRLSLAGIFIGIINVLIIVCIGIINKGDINTIVREAAVVFVNGILSIVLTLGTLPFWELTFNIITPLKLLELANPNQPLIKRLLMEAPGTYHHSLMVGNLAEVATEAIGGNSLLARVGAYFHDAGKLKRPNFFKENQMADNPHDRMTANLSTLVITSHTQDGVELAEKYKIPLAIREIIKQHHGTTLVAYFYHKAKKCEKVESVKPENYRYEGPKPSTKESAVVMLADSVEAAVRAMVDKTEGKIEGLVRKIIKDKLDDGQLDQCELTLKDLDNIAKAFMRVLSGLFHEREEYPQIKANSQAVQIDKHLEQLEEISDASIIQDEEIKNVSVD
ncbi:MAG: HDIG domain-containing protein [Clostridia bacterium]|nr:HDIG domain-containing protein [Clostridia bacterium]